MRWLILSDIHANWEALQAVLQAAEGRYDDIICLGDVVDYGADPKAAIHWVRQNVKHVIRGNHDRVCSGGEGLDDFMPLARQAAIWTRNQLPESDLSWLHGLPVGPAELDGFTICHGSPADEDEYLITPEDVAPLRQSLERDVTFFGHTHLQGGFTVLPQRVQVIGRCAGAVEERALEVKPGDRYLFNPGAVGQPRDGDPRAAYGIYDSARRVFFQCRAGYDVTTAMAKITAAGLPSRLAERLFDGC